MLLELSGRALNALDTNERCIRGIRSSRGKIERRTLDTIGEGFKIIGS